MKNVLESIAGGESETVEFKRSFGKDVIESLSAFANTNGGCVFIGIFNEKIVGVSCGDESLQNWANEIKQNTSPSIIPTIETFSHQGKTVVRICVDEFPVKPVAFKDRYYKRVVNSNHRMTLTETSSMHLQSTGQSMDAIIVPGKTILDIDLEAVREYMRLATGQGRRSFAEDEDPWRVLKKLELIKSEEEITRAAILLFGKTPQSPLTQAVVHAGRFREKVHIMDNRMIDGSIIEQVEETVGFIKKNMHVRFEITGNPQRKEIWDYPLPALREAVVNAIVHRDYGDTADIQIKMFEDALQIWSPGFLPYNVTVGDLFDPEHTSKPRNKLIAQTFYDLGLIERYGSGIQRILDACIEENLPTPIFENFSGGFRIKFILPEQPVVETPKGIGTLNGALNGTLNGTLNERVFEMIRRRPDIRRKDIIAETELPVRTIARVVAALISENKIERRGSKKTGGYWAL